MVKYMAKIGVPDFQFKDYINPQPKRTRRFLSNLLNFLSFVDSQSEKFEEINRKASEAKEEQLRLQTEIEGFKKQINTIRKKTMEEEPLFQQTQEEIAAKRAELEQLAMESRQLKEKFATIKLHGTEVACSNADMVLKIQKAKQDNAAVTSQIVRSPERLKEEVNQEKQRLEARVEEKRRLQDRLQELVEHREHLKGVQTTFGTYNEHMDNIATELKKERDVDARLKETRSNTQRQQRELNDVRMQVSDLSELLSNKREKVAAFEMQHSSKMNALQQKLKSVQSDAEMMEQYRTERDIVLTDLEEKHDAVLKEMNEMNLKADEIEAHIKSQLCTLSSKVDEFNQISMSELLEIHDQMVEGRKADEEKLKWLEDLDFEADDLSI